MAKRSIYLFLILIFLVASACALPFNLGSVAEPTQDVAAMQTEIAQNVMAGLTNTAAAAPTQEPPTATSEPTATSAPTETQAPAATVPGPTSTPLAQCDSALFVSDVTIDDGTNFAANESFVKTWRLKNTGSCAWSTSYALAFESGDAMGGLANIALPASVAPGAYVDLSVSLKAPASAGDYRGFWGLKNASGAWVPVTGGTGGRTFYVDISVGGGGSASEPFAVTKVGFNVTRDGTCAAGKYVITANITVNKAGTVNYHWIRSDGASGPGTLGSMTFASAGKKQATFEWNTSVSGLWVDIYIDDPNNQKFGRANLNCP